MIPKSNDLEGQHQPSQLISLKEAKSQLDNFKKAHPGVVGDQFALRGWISIQDLEKYIEFVKKESLKNGIEVNGIDFMFTQHKDAAPGLKNPNNSEYELSLMYAPTVKQGSSNVAFDPLHSKKNEPALLKDLLNSESSTENAIDQTGIGNRINCCPNMCF